MNTLICLSGLDTAEFLRLALTQINTSTHLVLLHVVDTRPSEEIGYTPRRQIFGATKTDSLHKTETTERALSLHVIAEARAHCIAVGFADSAILSEMRQGRPEHEILNFASQLRPDLLVIGARSKGSSLTPIGPSSLGPVARFLIEQAACNLLIIK